MRAPACIRTAWHETDTYSSQWMASGWCCRLLGLLAYNEGDRECRRLVAARRVGLAIPAMLVSNDPDEVRAFTAAAPGPMVYKCFSQALDLPGGQAQFTGVVTPTQHARLDLIRTTPRMFQQYALKRYEPRITVVGERVFAGRINSQAAAESSVDWRHRPFDTGPEPYALPNRIRRV
jgi:hypothetical protein